MSEFHTSTLRIIHQYFCNGIYHPVFWSVVAIAATIAVNSAQLFHLAVHGNAEFLFASDYLVDIVQVTVSLLFILRFSMGYFFGPVGETILLLLQNIGCGLLLFHHQYSLVYTPISSIIKVFIICQIACPYGIIAINIVSDWCKDDDDKTPPNYREFVIDTNNNFLPVFMGHSFLCINSKFPFAVWPVSVTLYKLAQLVIKFYCIHVFCLFEMVLIHHDIILEGLAPDYAEYYTPVVLGEVKQSAPKRGFCSRATLNKCLLVAMATIYAFDVLFVVISIYGG
jgi:hypothetical protein